MAAYTGPFPFTNNGTVNSVSVTDTTFSGGITNAGVITPGAINVVDSTINGEILDTGFIAGGITVVSSTINGEIVDTGFVAGGISVDAASKIQAGSVGVGAIFVEGSSFLGGIINNGTLQSTKTAGIAVGVASFGGGISNSGSIQAGVVGIEAVATSTFGGGISNSGSIQAGDFGITLSGQGILTGGVSNSGVINAVGGILVSGSTFGGGVSNSGTIDAGNFGILVGPVSTFSGGVNNSGTISVAGTSVMPSNAFGISVDDVASFGGGVVNSGSIISSNEGIALNQVATVAGTISNMGFITGRVGIAATASGAISIFDSGTIDGTDGTAIDLSQNAGGNALTLGAGYSITGNVLGSGSDTFQLGGAGDGSFNLNTLGTQYTGFSTFDVVSGTWTVTGTFAPFAPWTVEGGTLIEDGTLSIGAIVDNTGTLVLSTGSNVAGAVTLYASATLEFDSSFSYQGPVTIAGAVDFAVAAGQTVTLTSPVFDGVTAGELIKIGAGTLVLGDQSLPDNYTGGTVIDAGTLEIGSGSTVVGSVTFAGNAATLRLDSGANQIGGGEITGAAVGDAIDLRFASFAAGERAVWSQGAGGGGLSLDSANGATLASLNLTGNFAPQQFTALSDGSGGTLIDIVPQPPNAPPASGTSADMITRNGIDGDFEIYDVGRNTILGAGYLGQVGLEWQVAGFGDFGGDASDMIVRNGATGQFEVYDISNNNIASAAALGQVGLEWQVAGFGDFSGNSNETDMLMRNSNTGAFEVFDIANNTITSAAPMGQVGLEWQVAGFGDFAARPNETDMLMRNSNTGTFEVFDIANNTITSAVPMRQVGLEWQVAGFGDFSGNANETDMLMRNSNTGAFEVFDIANNTITSAAPMGQVGLEWQVAGFGDFSGNANETDMLMRNSNTGAFEVFDISHNTITSDAPMGQVGLEWQVGGIAPASLSQLTQAMAGFAPANGGFDTSSPLGPAMVQSVTPAMLVSGNTTSHQA